MVGKLFESYPKSVPLCYFLPYCFTTMNPLSCSVHCLSAFPRSLTSLSPSHELNGLHLFIYSFLALSCSYQVIKNKQSLYLATKKVNFLIVLLKTHCQKGDFQYIREVALHCSWRIWYITFLPQLLKLLVNESLYSSILVLKKRRWSGTKKHMHLSAYEKKARLLKTTSRTLLC